MKPVNTISPQQAAQKIADGATLIDVREYPEWVASHVKGAKLIPLDQYKANPSICGDGEVIFLCRSGRRAREAAEAHAGRGEAHVVEGGIEAWKASGLPHQSAASGPISLERQVRIGAGTLVLLGLLVPRLRILAYFVPCGLIFAGITDFCGMAKLLAKAPWNKPRH